MQARCEGACEKATIISHAFEQEYVGEQELMKTLLQQSEISDGFFLYEPDGTTIVSYGEQTYLPTMVPTWMNEVLMNYQYTLHADESMQEMLGDKRTLYVKVWNGIFDGLTSLANGDDMNVPLYSIVFWLKTTLSDGRVTMVKCNADLRLMDVVKAGSVGIFAFVLLMAPVVFMFINVIIGVWNQKQMTRLLYTNTVTAGNSYAYFEHTAGRILQQYRPNSTQYMIVDLTLMKYRSYCNYHGIHAGEALLEAIDNHLSGQMQGKEFCALAGKSSFVLFLTCKDKAVGEARVSKLLDDLSKTFGHGGIVFHAGICHTELPMNRAELKKFDLRKLDPADYFNCAGAARASLTDENTQAIAIYDETLMKEQLWEHRVEEKMEQALEKCEFQVYIQPKYDPVTEKLAGAEALVRWVNEEDGFISPGRFIPIFERNGFITKLDDYMISNIAKLQADWIQKGKTVVPISVNVSRAHFANPELAKHICSLVDAYQVPHNLIEIELTESAFFDDKSVMLRTVRELRRLGFEVSMDDFGAGYSSLNSLKDLPLDVLKLDADFFRGEDAEERGEIVVSQAIALAKRLNMRIVAEGVEKKEQVDFLAEQGCDMIQGYYFAKPMPASEYAERL